MSKTPEELIDVVCKQMESGFSRLESCITQTNSRLDDLTGQFTEFRAEVRQDFRGIASFLEASEGNVHRLEKRIIKCETRLDKLDRPEQSA
jgi:predicted RNase H-like nuclease (RuvC/YqgF family)